MICKQCFQSFEETKDRKEYCSKPCSNRAIAQAREKKKENFPVHSIWSCGGGLQSTALGILISIQKITKPDYAIIIDCGWEKQSTWDYLDSFLYPKMLENGVEIDRIKTLNYTDNSLFDKGGHLVIPAFHRKDEGTIVKYQTHCNGNWKQLVSRRYAREKEIKKAEYWIGISKSETRRERIPSHKWYAYKYPLIEIGLTNDNCKELIDYYKWKQPPRTSCFICPLQHDSEWKALKDNYPDQFKMACDIDEQIRDRDPDTYLHQSIQPLRDVKFIDNKTGNRFWIN